MDSGDWSDFNKNLIQPLHPASQAPVPAARPRRAMPTGAESAGIEWDGTTGELRTGAVTSAPGTWDDLIIAWGLDPAEVEVVEPVRRSSWEQRTADGEVVVLNSFRARIQRRRVGGPDIEKLMAEIRDHEGAASRPGGDMAFVLAPADLQCGKGDPQVLIARYLAAVDSAAARLLELRESGRSIGAAYVLYGGDLIENVANYYANQPFVVALNLTDQLRIVRRLMLHTVKQLAPLVETLVIGSAPGNHDQASRNAGGKTVTDSGDSFATGLLYEVADILAENPEAYGHVRFAAPPKNDPLVLTLDVLGTVVAVAHGHQFLGKDGHKWWAGQAAGLRPAGEATILISGHFHHLRVIENGPRLWLQVPSLDTEGSEWFTSATGCDAATGMVSLVVGGGRWQDFAIH